MRNLSYDESMAPQSRRQLRESIDISVAAARDAPTVLEVAGSDAESAREIATVYDAEIVILTHGDEGAIAFEADGTRRDRSPSRRIGSRRPRTIRLKVPLRARRLDGIDIGPVVLSHWPWDDRKTASNGVRIPARLRSTSPDNVAVQVQSL